MKLKDWLELNQKNQTEFAKLIGVNANAISRYINGERTPKKELMQKIHEATNGVVSYNDWYQEISIINQNTKNEMIKLSVDENFSLKLRETLMKHFDLSKNIELFHVVDNDNAPDFVVNDFLVIDLDCKDIQAGGYFIAEIGNDQEKLYKIIRKDNQTFLTSKHQEFNYNNKNLNIKIKGKVKLQMSMI